MLDKQFNPATAETEIFKKWEQNNLFAAQPQSGKPAFSIIIPPPNVTGVLHMGHALDNSIQDVLCRYKRMKGFDVLWQPGMDHAGIATQVVVEKLLAKEGKSRHDFGREKFIEKVWEWKEKSGGQIINQLKALGASCDWDRTRFTMDEGLSAAVRKIFVKMFKDGLIYKDKRLVNWDSKLQTAVSDLEVIQKETVGTMWYMNYPVENEPGRFITVATTRPETFFGDTAVAVSAEDERYKDIIGKNVILPIVNRPIPVVADEHADPEKGTGAVKITPAHDFNDFEVGRRHNLPMINILDVNARLNENVPAEFQGMDTMTARAKVLERIKELGLYVKEEPNPMTIPYGDRTGVVIEPYLTDQWFVDTKEIGRRALEAVEDGSVKMYPENMKNTYYEWMRNLQPWCISRQLWWGHQVPVWYGPDGHMFCEETELEAKIEATKHYGEETVLRRDSDVLDTWFSSGLWAFSTMGWPNESDEYLKRYYPTSVLVTGFDIIFFWVARMMMMSLYAMKEIPFKEICFHGLVRDEKGQKMSKSKNNGIDPLEMIAKYGADALRMSLLVQAGTGRDVLIGDSRVEAYRNFATKIWNSAKFCEMNDCKVAEDYNPAGVKLPMNAWIITKLSEAEKEISNAIETYSFNDATQTAYHFVWGVFCDWYLEMAKPIFYGDSETAKKETRSTMAFVFDKILGLLHPFMPFITEELWDKTAERKEMLMASAWPNVAEYENAEETRKVDWAINMVSAIRSVRSEMNISAGAKIKIRIQEASDEQKGLIGEFTQMISFLARVEEIDFVSEPLKGAVSTVYDGMIIMIPLEGLIDVDKEKMRLTKEMDALSGFIERTLGQLANEAFVSKAPEKVINDKRNSLAEAQDAMKKLQEAFDRIAGL